MADVTRLSMDINNANKNLLNANKSNDGVEVFMGSQGKGVGMSPAKSMDRTARIPVDTNDSLNTFESPRFYLEAAQKQNSAESAGLDAIYRKNYKDETGEDAKDLVRLETAK